MGLFDQTVRTTFGNAVVAFDQAVRTTFGNTVVALDQAVSATFGNTVGAFDHMALQYARRMGFRVIAVGRGTDIEQDAMDLGAHDYIDSSEVDAAEALKNIGGAHAIVTTIGVPAAVSALMSGLVPQGRLILLGAGKDPLPVSTGHLVVGERSLLGSITGTPYENEKTLDFSVLAGVRPRIEVMPFEQANEAYQRMKSGGVKFRMVLTVDRKRNNSSTSETGSEQEKGAQHPCLVASKAIQRGGREDGTGIGWHRMPRAG